MFPSLITTRAFFQFSNLCTPHGSELNFNNISRTKPAERTSQWRGTNAQFFSSFLDIYNIVTHIYYDKMLSAMLWLYVTESVTQV